MTLQYQGVETFRAHNNQQHLRLPKCLWMESVRFVAEIYALL